MLNKKTWITDEAEVEVTLAQSIIACNWIQGMTVGKFRLKFFCNMLQYFLSLNDYMYLGQKNMNVTAGTYLI